jgi:hypothetical protein
LIGGVAGQLGAVQGDGADPDHASGAQLERRHQEPGEGLLVAGAEPRDDHVVGGRQHPEGDVLGQAPFDLPGGAHPDRICVEEHAEEERWVVGGVVVPVGPVRPVEECEVKLVDDVQDEPGQVVGREPIAQVGGSRKGWSRSQPRKL